MATALVNNASDVTPILKPDPNKRVTMIKHVVGKVRSSSHCLPGDDFVFGIPNKIDQEGAGQVLVQNRSITEPSQPRKNATSFPLTNKEALQKGCITSKAQREFQKKNPIMKQNPKSISKKCALPEPKKDQIFGIKSFANDATMTELLRCAHTINCEETDYPDLSGMQKTGRLPPAKSTKSSRLLQESTRPLSKESVANARAKEMFKLKRFLKAESKVKSIRKRAK